MPEYIENQRFLQENNPNYSYKFYSASERKNFIGANYESKILNLYNSIDLKYPAAQADFFRYLVIYKIGGIYLDIDSTILKPLESIINKTDRFIVSNWPSQIDNFSTKHWGQHRNLDIPEFQNFFIMSEPNSEIMEAVIKKIIHNLENYNPFWHGVGWKGTLNTTGPIMYTKALIPFTNSPMLTRVTNEYLGIRHTVFKLNSPEQIGSIGRNHYSKNFHSLIKTNSFINFFVIIYSRILHPFRKILDRYFLKKIINS